MLLQGNFNFVNYLKCISLLLTGGGAWTAGIPNNEQRLCVDLGYRTVVTGVATQGRRGSYEYVTEYYLEFSSDNKTWNVYTNPYGTPLVRNSYSLHLYGCIVSIIWSIIICTEGLCKGNIVYLKRPSRIVDGHPELSTIVIYEIMSYTRERSCHKNVV